MPDSPRTLRRRGTHPVVIGDVHRIDDSRILSGSDTVPEPDRIRESRCSVDVDLRPGLPGRRPALRAYCQLGSQSSSRHHHMGMGVAVRIGQSQAKLSTTIVA